MAVPRSPKNAPGLPKDREATKRRLIAAVGRVLARQGFRAVGVNAVAREAGVDKVLIYRYFDGLPGLVAAFSREGNFWPDVDELAGGDRQAFLALSFTERMAAVARNYLRAIRARPLTQEILSWRFLEHNELTEALDTTRAEVGQGFLELAATGVTLPPVDLTAFNALLGAAVHHLVVRELHDPTFAGLPLDDPASWDRLEAMIGCVIRGVLDQG